MPRVGAGTTLATGIVAYAHRIRVTAGAGRQQREKSYAIGTALATMQAWQLRAKADLLETEPDTAERGTLAADAPRYLATIADPKTRAYQAHQLTPWIEAIGHLSRKAVTSVLIRQTLATWRSTKSARGRHFAASSLNHRLAALRALYRVLDADDDAAVNPAARVRKLREPKPEPREIPAAVLDAIFAALPERRYRHQVTPATARAIYAAATKPRANRSAIARKYGISETAVRKIVAAGPDRTDPLAATKLRLAVKRTTGLPWAQIAQIRPEHLRRAPGQKAIAGHLWVTPRRKGHGTEGKWLPLTRDGLRAIVALLEDAPGPFSSSSIRRVFARALARVVENAAKDGRALPDFPDGLRPYDIRHTFLTQVYRASRDRKATQGLGLHADPRTTDRYIVAAEADGEAEALTALSRGTRRLAR